MRDDASPRGAQAPATLRLDKWLWCTRFFRSRAEATAAVAGGHVHLGGERVRPSRGVRAGDRLAITKGETRYEVIIEGLPVRRGPAAEARGFYSETPESEATRTARREQVKFAPPAPSGRPDKHARRALRNLRGR